MGVVARACNFSARKVEAGASVVEMSWLHREFEPSLGCMNFCLKSKRKKDVRGEIKTDGGQPLDPSQRFE